MVIAERESDAEAGECGRGQPEHRRRDMGQGAEGAAERGGDARGPPGAKPGRKRIDDTGPGDQDHHHRGDQEIKAHRGTPSPEPDRAGPNPRHART